jgi:hypothetical protein
LRRVPASQRTGHRQFIPHVLQLKVIAYTGAGEIGFAGKRRHYQQAAHTALVRCRARPSALGHLDNAAGGAAIHPRQQRPRKADVVRHGLRQTAA